MDQVADGQNKDKSEYKACYLVTTASYLMYGQELHLSSCI